MSLVAEFLTSCEEADLSFSLGADRVEERLTLYFRPTPGLLARLSRFAALMGMEASAISAWRAAVPGADAVGMTLSRDLRSFRLYCQHFERHLAAVEAGDDTPFEAYQGFKGLPDGSLRHDSYLCRPLLARAQMAAQMRPVLEAAGLGGQIEALLACLVPERVIWAKVGATGDARHSWIVTLRELNLAPEQTAGFFAPLALRHAPLRSLLARAQVLHLAGGQDPLKGSFVTLYLEPEAEDLAAFLGG